MEYANSACIYLKTSSIQMKIMNFMLFKSIGTGFYHGIKNFKKSDQPVSQLFEKIISYSLTGIFEAVLWPITFTHFVTVGLDKIALEIMNKPNNNNTTN